MPRTLWQGKYKVGPLVRTVWNMKMKSIIIFIASDLKHWNWFNFTSIAERTCRDAKNLLWKIRSMTCRNVKNNWNWYFNLKSVFNSIDQIQFVILLKGNVDNALLTFLHRMFLNHLPTRICRNRKKGRNRNKQNFTKHDANYLINLFIFRKVV